MPKDNRVSLLKEIGKERSTCVITYITSTRPNLEVPMAMDAIRKVYDHLEAVAVPRQKLAVDLFIHSNGGDGTVPWRLVTLIREYATKFSVLVPYKAFSAATLAALGADKIVMHPMGMLGPTDPTVGNPFNPDDPNAPGQKIGISVEDVTAFISLIKEDAGIQHEDELVQAFNKLSDKVHPLALGNVKRSLSQSRMMAQKLLSLHMDKRNEEHKIDEIVDSLTSKLFYHGHPINRAEAKDEVGLKTVEHPPAAVEKLMWSLYLDYEVEMKMEEPFDAAAEFVAQQPATPAHPAGTPPQAGGAITPIAKAKLAYIESTARTDVLTMEYKLSGLPQVLLGPAGAMQIPGATQVHTVLQRRGWGTE
jgi:Serine dehydrogenase proteinase